MRFWDTSAITPLLLQASQTHVVKSLIEQDSAMIVWWATRVELSSAFARLLREEKLSLEEVDRLKTKADELWSSAAVVQPSSALLQRAEELLFRHILRAADAFQLAAARVALRQEPEGFGFVTLDHRLRDAAAREGFTVYPA